MLNAGTRPRCVCHDQGVEPRCGVLFSKGAKHGTVALLCCAANAQMPHTAISRAVLGPHVHKLCQDCCHARWLQRGVVKHTPRASVVVVPCVPLQAFSSSPPLLASALFLVVLLCCFVCSIKGQRRCYLHSSVLRLTIQECVQQERKKKTRRWGDEDHAHHREREREREREVKREVKRERSRERERERERENRQTDTHTRRHAHTSRHAHTGRLNGLVSTAQSVARLC